MRRVSVIFLAVFWSLSIASGPAKAITNTGPAMGTTVFEDRLPITVSWALGPSEESQQIEFSIWPHPPDLSQFGAPNRTGDLAPSAASSPTFTIGPGWYLWRVQVRNTSTGEDVYGPNGYFIVLDALSKGEAAGYTRSAIRRHARHATISSVRCSRRGEVRAKCRFAAFLGDTVWVGRGRVFFSTQPQDNLTRFHYRFKVRRKNTYCLDVLHKSPRKCVKRQQWRL